MSRIYYLLKIVFIFALVQHLKGDGDKEMCDCIGMRINGDTGTCGDDWDNAPVQMSFQPKTEPAEQDDLPDLVCLDGEIKVKKTLDDQGITVDPVLSLLAPEGKEIVWSGSADLCQSMGDNTTLWYPMLSTMGDKCPITDGDYYVPRMCLDLSFLDEYMTEDFMGQYLIQMELKKGIDKIACIVLGAVVDEFEMPCKQCKNQEDKRR